MTILKSDPPWVGSLLCPPSLKGDANGAPRPEASSYAQKFSGKYAYRTINGGIGHNLPQEAPQVFAEAVVEAGGLLNPPKLHGHADETSNMALNLWRSFVNRAARTSSGRTRTANRAVVVFFLRCNKRNFTGPISLRPPGGGSPTTRRPVGTKFEFERFVAPNLQKAIAMWWLDARRSHFCDAFIDGDGAARVAVTSGAINQHIAALSKTGPAELRARRCALVNEAPWRRACVITGLHRFV